MIARRHGCWRVESLDYRSAAVGYTRWLPFAVPNIGHYLDQV